MSGKQDEDKVLRTDVRNGMRDDVDSEVWTVPLGGLPTKTAKTAIRERMAPGFGEEGSNAGEVDLGVSGSGGMFASPATPPE